MIRLALTAMIALVCLFPPTGGLVEAWRGPMLAQAKKATPKPSNAEGLLAAARAGDTARVKALLAQGADANVRGDKGWTPLQYAALGGYREAAEVLIAKGANLNALSDDGATPLMAATLKGHVELVKLLVAKGAGVDLQNQDGQTALTIAKQKGMGELAEILQDAAAKTTNVAKATGSPDAQLHYKIAVKALEKNDLKIAKEELLMARDLAPNDAMIWYGLGVVQSQLKESDDAVAALRRAIKLGLPERQKDAADDLLASMLYEQKAKEAQGAPIVCRSPNNQWVYEGPCR